MENPFTGEFLEHQRKWLLARRESKLKIMAEGGVRAQVHSPSDIVRIDYALRRIADGQYGLCVQCGTPIELQRLKFMPETPLCASCAKTKKHHTHH